ncbi:glycosyltransferase family 4 protein [Microbacterium sp. BH-3-3-3]|uniref:glycosyltransferase family 4 protein n=1 Tax=Microbacterium sp. BH-3-3-3 TaxID=1906742 RepID=UPI0016432699|nr:glycosyltransferase family 4 protein [Microbacterium sp. BH-3-3-3]
MPIVVTIHGSRSLHLKGPSKAIYSWLLRRANIVHGFGENYRVAFNVPNGKWRRLPNDVFVPGFIVPKDGAPVFSFVGAVGDRKGVDLLVEAWRIAHQQFPNARLIVAGPDASHGVLPKRIEALPDATYIGAISNSEALLLMESAHTLVQPSRAEAFPVAVCEALGRGCAVVGTDVGAMGELLREANQIVVRPEAQSIADGLVRSLDHKLGVDGYRFASANLSTAIVSQRWARLYTDAIGNRT